MGICSLSKEIAPIKSYQLVLSVSKIAPWSFEKNRIENFLPHAFHVFTFIRHWSSHFRPQPLVAMRATIRQKSRSFTSFSKRRTFSANWNGISGRFFLRTSFPLRHLESEFIFSPVRADVRQNRKFAISQLEENLDFCARILAFQFCNNGTRL